jgi:hypothetical protein
MLVPIPYYVIPRRSCKYFIFKRSARGTDSEAKCQYTRAQNVEVYTPCSSRYTELYNTIVKNIFFCDGLVLGFAFFALEFIHRLCLKSVRNLKAK